MGAGKVLSIAGHQDIVVLRNQPLNSVNSLFKLSRSGAPFDTTVYGTFTFDIYNEPDFQVASPIISLSKAGATVQTQVDGFYLAVPAATLDVDGKTYYYAVRGDGDLILTGKFVVTEFPETL